MYILLLFDEVFYKCQFGSHWLMVLVNSTTPLLIFWLLDLPTTGKGVLKLPTIIMDLSISPCSSISFCLTYFDTLLLGMYTLRHVGLWPTLLFSISEELLLTFFISEELLTFLVRQLSWQQFLLFLFVCLRKYFFFLYFWRIILLEIEL